MRISTVPARLQQHQQFENSTIQNHVKLQFNNSKQLEISHYFASLQYITSHECAALLAHAQRRLAVLELC